MAKFRVKALVTVSAWVEIEAKDAAEAIREARGLPVELCPHGPDRSGFEKGEVLAIEEADGAPFDFKAEEA